MMNTEWDGLLALIQEHVSRYENLSRLLQEEQAALIHHDLERLHETAFRKQAEAEAIQAQVPVLAEAIDQLASRLALPAEPRPTLIELARIAPTSCAPLLRRFSLALSQLKQGILRDSRTNQAFVREALDTVTESIAFLSGAISPPGATYLASGHQAAAGGLKPVRLNREV
ncbi:MAG: flagellar protein FlgN [Thermodesulfobacteriota bacterium]